MHFRHAIIIKHHLQSLQDKRKQPTSTIGSMRFPVLAGSEQKSCPPPPPPPPPPISIPGFSKHILFSLALTKSIPQCALSLLPKTHLYRVLAVLNQNLTQFSFTGSKPKQPMGTIGSMRFLGFPKTRLSSFSAVLTNSLPSCTLTGLDRPNSPGKQMAAMRGMLFRGFPKRMPVDCMCSAGTAYFQ